MDRSQKEALVTSLHEQLSDTVCVVITHQTGMTVAEVTDLRRQMRAAGASFKVTKNRLARIALTGTKFEQLSSLFTGPTAIAYSRDPVAAAKVAVEFANKNDKLSIVGGSLGEQQLDVAGVEVARHNAIARSTSRQASRHAADPGDTDRQRLASAWRPGGEGAGRLCAQGRSGRLSRFRIIRHLKRSQECKHG